ncbi:hypothetical protein F53441_1841 [Fusarium austroafricanum]|uniref:Uncharacterized protein n=1 Tax=Fusarium austroafricanum TaxID=2364996 RepID=A0A8H4KUH6_9HYPO|nr:hypothetical protein F53441_1841 [Fusarium austroafricanum]
MSSNTDIDSNSDGETHPIFICLRLLESAIRALNGLQQALGLELTKIPELPRAPTIVTKEGNMNAVFDVDIYYEIGELDLAGFVSRFKYWDVESIIVIIFGQGEGEGGLLKIIGNLRMYCRKFKLLPPTLRWTAVAMYLDFFLTLYRARVVGIEELVEFRPLVLLQKALRAAMQFKT